MKPLSKSSAKNRIKALEAEQREQKLVKRIEKRLKIDEENYWRSENSLQNN